MSSLEDYLCLRGGSLLARLIQNPILGEVLIPAN